MTHLNNTFTKMDKLADKGLAIALIAAVAMFGAKAAYAADEDIGASAEFRSAVALSNVVDMNYGTVDYSAAAANNITLDANAGTISCSNTTDYSCPASGTAGAVDIAGTTGQDVNISCETTGTVSDGTNTLALNSTEIRIDGTDTACAGLGTSPVSFTLTSGTDTVNVGAVLAITSAGIQADGTYNTSNASGDPVAVRVVYQ